MILLIYVDDIIFTENDEHEQQRLSQYLGKEFEIKTLGKVKYFLRIEVAHSKKGIFISQQKYIIDLLHETSKTACKPASTPVDPNTKLGSEVDGVAVNKEMYQRLIGRLIYLPNGIIEFLIDIYYLLFIFLLLILIIPDIALAVSLVSQLFMHQPKEAQLQVALRIVQ